MPILLAAGDHTGASALVMHALRTHTGPAPQAAHAVGGLGTPVDVILPHPVFDLGLNQLLDHKDLSQARSGGFRYLVMQGPSAIAAAEVTADAEGKPQRVASINRGPFVEATQVAVRKAESLAAVRSGSFELRLLRIPALYIAALWLKDAVADRDMLIPLAPAPSYLTPGQAYSTQVFLELAYGAAEPQSSFDSRPRRGPAGTSAP